MSKTSLRDISRKLPSTEDIRRAYKACANLDDRSCVIMLTSILERGLERLLIAKMVRAKSDMHSRIFCGSGPLATLSGKIRISQAFGFVGPKTTHAFDIFNEIRNVFAHSAHVVTFRNKRIQDRLTGVHNWAPATMLADALPHFDDVEPWEKKLYSAKKGHFVALILTYVYALDLIRWKSKEARDKGSAWLSQ